MNETLKVFVYGTLKVGGKFAVRFDEVRKTVAPAIAKGTLFNVGWFPAAIFGGDTEIVGEFHEYTDPDRVASMFDSIEGCHGESPNNLYNRKTVEVLVNGKPVKCLAYEFNKDTTDMEVVETGIWEI